MEHHEPVIEVVNLTNVPGDPGPVGHAHVGGVHQVVPLVDGIGDPLDVGDHGKHEHVVIIQSLGRELLVVESAQLPEVVLELVLGRNEDVLVVPCHTDGAPRVDNEHLAHDIGVHFLVFRDIH